MKSPAAAKRLYAGHPVRVVQGGRQQSVIAFEPHVPGFPSETCVSNEQLEVYNELAGNPSEKASAV